ncbi:hypothetical protein [Agaribacter flavus]|uniref:Uncharacterized protein n=1 Tax=Agaribacter flavus TaxID=1902781 RepID=A0ABV7FLN2_9ALTE
MEQPHSIILTPALVAEFEYIVALHKRHGAPNPMTSMEDLVGYILASIADGSRRPGSWERQLLDMMGLVADCDAHHVYRAHYGEVEE